MLVRLRSETSGWYKLLLTYRGGVEIFSERSYFGPPTEYPRRGRGATASFKSEGNLHGMKTSRRYLVESPEDADVRQLDSAMDGIGADGIAIIEFLVGRSQARVRAAKAKWEGKHDKSLVDRIRSELHGANETLALELLKGERDEGGAADPTLAANQAEQLKKARGRSEIFFRRLDTIAARRRRDARRDARGDVDATSTRRRRDVDETPTRRRGNQRRSRVATPPPLDRTLSRRRRPRASAPTKPRSSLF